MRLIDVDALKADYGMADDCKDCKTGYRFCKYDRIYSKMDFCGWLDDASTVDAITVVHGRWIDETFKPWGLVHHPYKCDQCGEHSEAPSDYCPHCGARMDGKDGGDGKAD